MKVASLLTASLLLMLNVCCQKKSPVAGPSFSDQPIIKLLQGNPITEASGIADSRLNPAHLWVHEDSGNPPRLFLLSHDAKVVKTMFLAGAANRDWEELAIGPGPDAGKPYLYVGDVGDNNASYSSYTIYRFPEPALAIDTIRNFDKIVFTYADGPRDCEAFFVDSETKDIYLITKREAKGRIYKLAYPQETTGNNEAVFVAELPYSGVVGASVSADGREIIIKTYPALYYYSRKPGESIKAVLAKKEVQLPYKVELQGEAVAFAKDRSGYFTLSEKGFGTTVNLYFYKRK